MTILQRLVGWNRHLQKIVDDEGTITIDSSDSDMGLNVILSDAEALLRHREECKLDHEDLGDYGNIYCWGCGAKLGGEKNG